MANWNAMGARITLFIHPEEITAPQPSAFTLFQQMWGVDPQNYQAASAPTLPSIAQGQVDDMRVACSVSQNRIDFNFMPGQAVSGEFGIQVIENSGQLHSELLRVSSSFGKDSNAKRYNGFALFLHFAVAGQDNTSLANQTLMSVMPEKYRPRLEDEQDFVLQINRPLTSKIVDQIRTNTITKWSVDRIRVLILPFALAENTVVRTEGITQQSFRDFIAPTVTFEVNNMPPGGGTRLTAQEEGALLEEALSTIKQTQQDIGLQVIGFQ